MKYLGIDYGTKRIGIALSDESGEFAFPQGIIGPEKAISEIVALCEKEQVGAIVIGKSIASNGMDNEIVPVVEKFKAKLEEATSLPVHFQQESYSTMEAHRYQPKAGSRDDSAAAIILQRFLDTKKV
ncbi:MAG: Holliday junction resolvase YqgF, putative holliday junction resolvase [Candidatus Nomurabacteria bacterium]|nr:Holliday junction resolvase YqgF, putative holliday junction resolvase [Candidatus Nomurabacteria bacterium]